ncbi:MAG: hypothetical protein KIT83_03210 [Bryobacterales bacterium]|nr:hypothetical protein [Bryobacterales bacterium]
MKNPADRRLTPPGTPIQQNTQPGEKQGITQQDAVALVKASGQPDSAVPPRLSRVLCSELIEIEWKGFDGSTETGVANLEEIWRSGATLDADRPLPEGNPLIIRRGATELNARVIYCQQNLTGFNVGVQFIGESEWGPSLFLPAHAVELGALGKEPPSGEELEAHFVDDDTPSANASTGLTSIPIATGHEKGVVRSFALESLAPLIARGSLMALYGRMIAKQPG